MLYYSIHVVGAVQKWVATAHLRAQISDNCRSTVGSAGRASTQGHKELTLTRIAHDQRSVEHVLQVTRSIGNPFQPSENLVSLCSGVTASDNIAANLLQAEKKGEAQLKKFCEERLVECKVPFYETMHKLNLKTFRSLQKQATVKVKGKEVILKADRDIFARMIVIAQSRKLDLREVFKHTLGPVPWPLSNADGSFTKTAKVKLVDTIEKDVDPLPQTPDGSAWIIDLMAVLQSLSTSEIPETFQELAKVVLRKCLTHVSSEGRVDIVSDIYPAISIKNRERSNRYSQGELRIAITGSKSQKVPKQWKKFLSAGCNKEALVELFFNEWQTTEYISTIQRRSVYLNKGESCFIIQSVHGNIRCQEVEELESSHEEADTR